MHDTPLYQKLITGYINKSLNITLKQFATINYLYIIKGFLCNKQK